MNETDTVQLILSDARGIYLPQNFAEAFPQQNVKAEDWDILLSGPDHEWYWDAWNDILDTWKGPSGETIWQDGDLFLLGPGVVWNDDTDMWE